MRRLDGWTLVMNMIRMDMRSTLQQPRDWAMEILVYAWYIIIDHSNAKVDWTALMAWYPNRY